MAADDSATVTILFTDQVHSTDLAQRIGDDAADQLRRADFALLRESLSRYQGDEVKTIGDSLMAVFRSALNAMSCAIEMQQMIERANRSRPTEDATLLRVGIDAGEPIRREGDYWGTPVIIARRLCDCASAGQIVVSELVRGLVRGRGTFEYRDIGELDLKGIGEPVRAYDVVWGPMEEAPAAAEIGPGERLPSWLAPLHRTPFINREPELASLVQRWETARSGRRQVVMIEGEPGIGKTRLASEVALTATADGGHVIALRCDEASSADASLAAQTLRALSEHAVRPLRHARATPADADAIDAICSAAAERARALPLLVIVDDAQAADYGDASFVRALCRALDGSKALVALLVRASLAPGHPLGDALSDFRRDGTLTRITLRGMTSDATGALINGWSGHASPAKFTAAIHHRTEGNPFFIEEMLRHLTETDALYEAEGTLATVLDVDQLQIPEGVRALIVQRLSLLSDECARLLAAASVVGSEFDAESAVRASGIEDDAAVDLIEEALTARLIEEVRDVEDRYRFSHALIRETVYEGLTEARRLRVHSQSLRYAYAKGARIAYEVIGASGPVMIATGLTNCPAARVRSRAATGRWERISRFCRVILYDRRGVGSSEAPERGYSLRASVEDVRAVLDAHGSARCILWGATDGGPLALLFAALYPERVAGIVLVGTSARMLNGDDWSLGINPAVLESFFRVESLDTSDAIGQLTRVRRTADADVHAIMRMTRRIPPQVWANIRACIGGSDVRSELGRVHAPALILHDRSNTYIPFDAACYLRDNITGSKLIESDELTAPLFGPDLFHTLEGFVRQVTAANET